MPSGFPLRLLVRSLRRQGTSSPTAPRPRPGALSGSPTFPVCRTRVPEPLSKPPARRPSLAGENFPRCISAAAPQSSSPALWPDRRVSFSSSPAHRAPLPRSEEHTSELQSRSDLVCRLLLEKKKKIICLFVLCEYKNKKNNKNL